MGVSADRAVPWHYLRRNPRTTIPRLVVTFDTEAWVTETPTGTEQRFRLAVASCDRFPDGKRTRHATDWTDAATPAELWSWIAGQARTHATAWVYAHNLDYDLQVSSALPELGRCGYEVRGFGGGPGALWVRLTDGRRRLVLADLRSWLPMPLAAIGQAVGLSKLSIPSWRAAAARWEAYCRRDVEVTRAALLRLLEWWRTEDMGHWPLTGPAGAMAAFRHRFQRHRLLVHRDPDVLAMEREAFHAGRAEVRLHGLQARGPYTELDLVAAYAMIAAAAELPARLGNVIERPDLERWRGIARARPTIARVVVQTERPSVPARTAHGTCWPVGRFKTTLAGPEIELALELDAEVEITRCAWYLGAPILAEWAEWITGRLHSADPEADPLIRQVLRTWSRALIGKFGQNGYALRLLGTSDRELYAAGLYVDEEAEVHGTTYHLGHQLFLREPDGEAENAMPAIPAYVASHLRAALTRRLELLPERGWVYCDTDGVILDPAGTKAMGRVSAAERAFQWVPKATYERVLALGVQTLELDGQPRIHGLPRKARPAGERTWTYERWPSLPWHLQRAAVGRFLTRSVTHTLRAPYSRGWCCDCGLVHPLRLDLVDGTNVVLPWSRSRPAGEGHGPADRRQVRALPTSST